MRDYYGKRHQPHDHDHCCDDNQYPSSIPVMLEQEQADWLEENPRRKSYIKHKEVVYKQLDDIRHELDHTVRISNRVTPGSFMVADHAGNLTCSDLTHQELVEMLSKKAELRDELVPGSLVIVSHNGKLDTAGLTYRELINALNKLEHNVDINSTLREGSIITADESGRLISSRLTCTGISDTLKDLKNKADIDNDISPGEILTVDFSGKIEGSGLTKTGLLSAIDALQTSKVELAKDTVAGSFVISDGVGRLKDADLTYDKLVSTLTDLSNKVNDKSDITGEIVPDALMVVDIMGNLVCSGTTHTELLYKLSKKVELAEDERTAGALVVTNGAGNIESTPMTYKELLATLSKKVEVAGTPKSGALVTFNSEGYAVSNDLTYDQLTTKLDELSTKKAELRTVVPGSFVVADETGNLLSTGVSANDLVNALKKKVESVPNIVTGALVVTNAEGKLETPGITYEELTTTLDALSDRITESTKVVGEITPDSLAVVDSSGKLICSGITQSKLIQSLDKKVEFLENDITPGSLAVVVDSNGNLGCTDVSFNDLVKKLDGTLGITGELKPGSLIVGDDSGRVISTDLTYDELTAKLSNIESTLSNKVDAPTDVVAGAFVAFDEQGNLTSSKVTYDKLVDYIKKSSVQSDWNEIDPNNPAYIKNKPNLSDDINELLKKKVEITNKVLPGTLMVATESGNIECSGYTTSDFLTAGSIVSGSVTANVVVTDAKATTVKVPEEVKDYSTFNVYHNGILMLRNVHYIVSFDMDYIALLGFDIAEQDYFTFVGYGNLTTAGTTNHTHDNKRVLDTITQADINVWNNAHEHSNKRLLDTITPEVMEVWNNNHIHNNHHILDSITQSDIDIWSNNHEHSNKRVLDSITQENVNNWNTLSHEHENKQVLDVLTQERINIWDNSANRAHEHSNQSVLDSITEETINVLNANNHTHSNKNALDGITQDRINIWDNSVHEHSNKSVLDSITQENIDIWNNHHTHDNQDILDSITQESIDVWNTVLTHNHDEVYVKSDTLFDDDGIVKASLLPTDILASNGLQLGQTATTAFRGDLGTIAYEHAIERHAPINAQENVIESITVYDTELPISNKNVIIPIGNAERFGVVKSSEGANKVTINEDGTMTVKNIDFGTLVTPEGDDDDNVLILSGGNATYKVKNIVRLGNDYYDSIFEAINNAKPGSTLVLEKNINLGENNLVFETENITLNLNNKTVTGNGSNGAIQVVSGNLTITGGGKVDATLGSDKYSMAVWCSGGTVTIENGTFTNRTDGSERGTDLIYASGTGKVIIRGGVFEAATSEWTLNCKDVDYNAGNASITVCGGSFSQYNPADCKAEGLNTNFVLDGYQSVENNGYYNVIQI